MHTLAESAFCRRQITGCGMSPTGWYITLGVLFVIATIGMLIKTLPRKPSPVYCTGTGSGQEKPHYHGAFAEADRCEGTRP